MLINRFVYLCLLLTTSLSCVTINGLLLFFSPLVSAHSLQSQADANQYLQQGIQHYHHSRFREAITSLESSLNLYQKLNDHLGEAEVLGYLGNIYYALGQLPEAINYHQQQLKITQKEYTFFTQTMPVLGIDNSSYINTLLQKEIYQKEINALNNLGSDYLYLKQLHKAKSFYQISLEISRKIDDNYEQALAFSNLGQVYTHLKEYEQALEIYHKSLTIFQKIKYQYGEAIAFSGLGNAYQALGDYYKSIQYYQKSLDIQKKIKDDRGQISSSINLGNTYIALNQYQLALESYQQSLLVSREINFPSEEKIVLNHIGNLLTQQKQTDIAILFYKQSINITETIRRNIQELPQESYQSYTTKVANTYHHLANILKENERTFEAQQILNLLTSQVKTRGVKHNIPINFQEQQIWTTYNNLLNQAVGIQKELTQLEKIIPRDRTPAQEQRIHQLTLTQAELIKTSTKLLQ